MNPRGRNHCMQVARIMLFWRTTEVTYERVCVCVYVRPCVCECASLWRTFFFACYPFCHKFCLSAIHLFQMSSFTQIVMHVKDTSSVVEEIDDLDRVNLFIVLCVHLIGNP